MYAVFQSLCFNAPFCSKWQACINDRHVAGWSHQPKSLKLLLASFLNSFPLQNGKICRSYILNNTAKATTWPIKVFEAWRDQCGKETNRKYTKDLLERPTVGMSYLWIQRIHHLWSLWGYGGTVSTTLHRSRCCCETHFNYNPRWEAIGVGDHWKLQYFSCALLQWGILLLQRCDWARILKYSQQFVCSHD